MHEIDRSVPLFFTRVRGTRIPITLQLVVDVLRVPRIEFPNYPNCERLRTVSKDELSRPEPNYKDRHVTTAARLQINHPTSVQGLLSN